VGKQTVAAGTGNGSRWTWTECRNARRTDGLAVSQVADAAQVLERAPWLAAVQK